MSGANLTYTHTTLHTEGQNGSRPQIFKHPT